MTDQHLIYPDPGYLIPINMMYLKEYIIPLSGFKILNKVAVPWCCGIGNCSFVNYVHIETISHHISRVHIYPK